MRILLLMFLILLVSCNHRVENINVPIFNENLILLAAIINAECGICDDSEKRKVGSVVLNRVDSPLFPNTITDVISEENQFHGIKSKHFYAEKSCLHIAESLINGEGRVYDIFYFWSSKSKNKKWVKKMKNRIIYTEKYHYYAK